MKKCRNNHKKSSKFILEELEPRVLFSGGIEGLITTELEPALATYIDIDSDSDQTSTQAELLSTASEQKVHEIVFVDTGVEGYQTLVDDIVNNTDSTRHIEVVLLDSHQNGIEQISDTLLNHDEISAIHIISHGEDGSIQLGNANLNASTLVENQLAITLWADSFTESGDILIYGCDLAETEIGKSLVNDLSLLTQTDVAASDDLTGNTILGGDWELEYKSGTIETDLAVSTSSQQDWLGVFATNALTPSYSQQVQGGGIVTDTAGMRSNAAFSGGTLTPTFNITGIPAGATVKDAFLYVNELDNGTLDSGFNLYDGTTTTGYTLTQIGSSDDPSWGSNGVVTFRGDVSSLVTGNGSYTLSGATLLGNDDYQGASLVVIYEDTSASTDSLITINDGSISTTDVRNLNQSLQF